MDFIPASPSTFPPSQGYAFAGQPEVLQHIESNRSSYSPRQYSDEEWNTLQPIIKSLYLDENKTWQEVLRVLKNGEYPITRRQFFRKIAIWKFQKNNKRGKNSNNERSEVGTDTSQHKSRRIKRSPRCTRFDFAVNDTVKKTPPSQSSLDNHNPFPANIRVPSESHLDMDTKLRLLFMRLSLNFDSQGSLNPDGVTYSIQESYSNPFLMIINDTPYDKDNSSISDLINCSSTATSVTGISLADLERIYSSSSISTIWELSPFPQILPRSKAPSFDDSIVQSWDMIKERLIQLYQEYNVLYRKYGPEATLDTLTNLAKALDEKGEVVKATTIFRYVAKTQYRKHGLEMMETLLAYNDLANSYVDQGKLAMAEKYHRPAYAAMLELFPASDMVYRVIATEGRLMYYHQKYKEAKRLQIQVLQLTLQYFGPRDSKTRIAMFELSNTLYSLDESADFLLLKSIASEITLELEGVNEGVIKLLQSDMVVSISFTEKARDAIILAIRASIEANRTVFGPTHPYTAQVWSSLIECLPKEALLPADEATLQHLFQSSVQPLGATHRTTLATLEHLAKIAEDMGRWEQAGKRWKKVFLGKKVVQETQNPDTLRCAYSIAKCLQQQERYLDAIKYLTLVHGQTKQSKPGEEMFQLYLRSCKNVGRCYRKLLRFSEAIEWYQEELEGRMISSGVKSSNTIYCVRGLSMCYELQGDLDSELALHQRVKIALDAAVAQRCSDSDYQDEVESFEILACRARGRRYEEEMDFDGAITLYQKTLEKIRWKGSEHRHVQALQTWIQKAQMGFFTGLSLICLELGEHDIVLELLNVVLEDKLDILMGQETEINELIEAVKLDSTDQMRRIFREDGRFLDAYAFYQSKLKNYTEVQSKEDWYASMLRHRIEDVQREFIYKVLNLGTKRITWECEPQVVNEVVEDTIMEDVF